MFARGGEMKSIYKIKCVNCGKSDHEVCNMSRLKGVKLRCLICGREAKGWRKLNGL